MFALAKSHDPEKADIPSTLPPKASFNNRNNLLIFNNLQKTKSHHHQMSGKNDKTPQTTSINVSVLCNWNESI
jgi:hypothetical protein